MKTQDQILFEVDVTLWIQKLRKLQQKNRNKHTLAVQVFETELTFSVQLKDKVLADVQMIPIVLIPGLTNNHPFLSLASIAHLPRAKIPIKILQPSCLHLGVCHSVDDCPPLPYYNPSKMILFELHPNYITLHSDPNYRARMSIRLEGASGTGGTGGTGDVRSGTSGTDASSSHGKCKFEWLSQGIDGVHFQLHPFYYVWTIGSRQRVPKSTTWYFDCKNHLLHVLREEMGYCWIFSNQGYPHQREGR
jgi:hypothetical protein